MDNDNFLRLVKNNEEVMHVCDYLNEQHDTKTASGLIPITIDPTRLVADMSVMRK